MTHGAASAAMRQLTLRDRHIALGARIAPFAGWNCCWIGCAATPWAHRRLRRDGLGRRLQRLRYRLLELTLLLELQLFQHFHIALGAPGKKEESEEAPLLENESPEDALALGDEQEERAIKIERTLAATDALAAMGWTCLRFMSPPDRMRGNCPLRSLAEFG